MLPCYAMEPTLDFSEHAIRTMVENNHVPYERLDMGESTAMCTMCGQYWPCPTLTDLRNWYEEYRIRQGMAARG